MHLQSTYQTLRSSQWVVVIAKVYTNCVGIFWCRKQRRQRQLEFWLALSELVNMQLNYGAFYLLFIVSLLNLPPS